jgi:hypothetical protein
MSALAFDGAKFVSQIEALGVELRVRVLDDGTPKIYRSYLGTTAPKPQIDVLWDQQMTSPERYRAVADFLLNRSR